MRHVNVMRAAIIRTRRHNLPAEDLRRFQPILGDDAQGYGCTITTVTEFADLSWLTEIIVASAK